MARNKCYNTICENKGQSVLIANVRNFSSPSKNSVSTEDIMEEECSEALYTVGDIFHPLFYANGNCKDNEGYVSITFRARNPLSHLVNRIFYLETNCTVSVCDVDVKKRFLQTFGYIYDSNSPEWEEEAPNTVYLEFGLGKYLKRETLLNEPTELLPRDCLTIYVEINYFLRYMILPYANFDTGIAGYKNDIHLDSEIAIKLCQVSDYFQSASETLMIETNTRHVHIPFEERQAFSLICYILDEAPVIKIKSIAEICDLYTVADKYLMKRIIETCRQWIKSFLCGTKDQNVREHVEGSIQRVLVLSDIFSDRSLKEIVEVYLEIEKDFETNVFEKELKSKLSTEWKCVYDGRRSYNNFKLIRTETDYTEMEFYK